MVQVMKKAWATNEVFKELYDRLRNCIFNQHKCGNYLGGKCREVGRYCFEIEDCEHWDTPAPPVESQ